MKNILVESTTDIKRSLGPDFQLMRDHDPLPRERSATKKYREELLAKYPQECPCCDMQCGRSKLDAAHIWPLEIGARTTKDNLILLCKICHKMYDSGYASHDDMLKCYRGWQKGDKYILVNVMNNNKKQSEKIQQTLRPDILDDVINNSQDVYNDVQSGKYRKALRKIAYIMDVVDQEKIALFKIVTAQINRRRAARGVLTKAQDILDRVDIKHLGKERLSLYYYEKGYIYQLSGNAYEASRSFMRSAQQAAEIKDSYSKLEECIGKAQYLATQVIMAKRGAETHRDISRKMDKIIDRLAGLDGAFAGRWVKNCMHWKYNSAIKAGLKDEAYSLESDIQEFTNSLTINTGYTKGFTWGYRGLSKVFFGEKGEAKEGLGMISRALVTNLAGNRRRPEGIRDLMLGFESGYLRLYGKKGKHVITNISDVRKSILDGSSYLDPYTSKAFSIKA